MKSLESPKDENSVVYQEYNFRNAFEQLSKPTVELVGKLKEAIEGEMYGTLIGDDASGRAPTLILRQILSERLEKLHQDMSPEEKRENLRTYFVAGGQGLGEETLGYLKLFFESLKKDDKKKFLFVTEYIQTGKSLEKLAGAMEAAGLEFDIASVFADRDAREIMAGLENRGHKVFIGSRIDVPPKIWAHEGISGVVNVKDDPNGKVLEAHAVPLVKDPSMGPISEELRAEIQRDINNSREDVKLLASRVIKRVWKK